jgi:hypothetical protein
MILEQIGKLVEELQICPDRTELLAAYAIRDRLDARIAVAVGNFDTDGLYELDGDLTMQTWLRHHARFSPTTAGRETLRARKLRALPVLAGAFLDGRLTGGQLDIILGRIPRRHLPLFAEHEPALVPTLEPLTVEDTAVAMGQWLAKADALDPGPEPAEADSDVHHSTALDGRGDLRGDLDPDLNALLEAGFRVADPKDFEVPPGQRKAEALRTILGFFLDNQHTHTAGRHRPHINVTMTYREFRDGIGGTYTDTGGPVSPTEAAALACDAVLHRIIVEGRSAILDYGRSVRNPPVDLFNAVLARDQGCRWPGCDRPASHCDTHHIKHRERDGPTSIANLVLLCRRHHRRHHHQKWRAKLEPDGTLHITSPDGVVETTAPPGPVPRQFWRTPDGRPARHTAA